MKDGVYYDLPEDEYRALPRHSYSGLKILAAGGTPAHYKAYFDGDIEKEESKSMQFGTLAHTVFLEPEQLGDIRQLPADIKQRRGANWEALQIDNPGVTYLPKSDWKKFESIKRKAERTNDNILENPVLSDLLKNAKTEVAILWTDPDTGVKCKGRIDALSHAIMDIKTTKEMDVYRKSRSGYWLGYDLQVAMYTDAVKIALGKVMKFWTVFIESLPPNLVQVFNGHACFDERTGDNDPVGYYTMGVRRYKSALATIAECEKSGEWPGHPIDIMEMVIPRQAESEV